MRIVSLVPSLTELLVELGVKDDLVGRTRFCIHPKEAVRTIPKIGGTKKVNIAKVQSLSPDLIIANKEENTKEDIEALEAFCRVHVTQIASYEDALDAIHALAALIGKEDRAIDLVNTIQQEFTALKGLVEVEKSVCYLIWNDPMMTVGCDTYIHDMLLRCGFRNIFGDQKRYPTISEDQIDAMKPDYLFLSSEPFPFKEKHMKHFNETFPESRVILVDGEYFSWYGSRMVGAASYFKELLQTI